MIEINKDAPEIRVLVDKYLRHLNSNFGIKPANANPLKQKDKSKFQKRTEAFPGTLYARMFQYLQDHFKEIIIAEPSKLQSKQEELLIHISYDENDPVHQGEMVKFKKTMTNYYDKFFQKEFEESGEKISIGRWLTRLLSLSVCPYCNHNYTLTINDRKNKIVVKPDFDHFYSKSKYPLLAISFFNLVPICTTCNKLKGEDEVFQNPYEPEHPRPKFRLYGKEKGGKLVLFGLGDALDEVEVFPEAPYSKDNAETCNIKRLGLKQIYDQHIDHVNVLIEQAQQYNIGTYSAMIESFQGLGKTEAEIDRIIWGRYKDHPQKIPLSKLTSDILEQIGLKEY